MGNVDSVPLGVKAKAASMDLYQSPTEEQPINKRIIKHIGRRIAEVATMS